MSWEYKISLTFKKIDVHNHISKLKSKNYVKISVAESAFLDKIQHQHWPKRSKKSRNRGYFLT